MNLPSGGVGATKDTRTSECMEEVNGVMMERNISRKLTREVLDSGVEPASTYGLETWLFRTAATQTTNMSV